MKSETCSKCGKVFSWDNSAFFGGSPASGWFGYICADCDAATKEQKRFEELSDAAEKQQTILRQIANSNEAHQKEAIEQAAYHHQQMMSEQARLRDDARQRQGVEQERQQQELLATLQQQGAQANASIQAAQELLLLDLVDDAFKKALEAEQLNGQTLDSLNVKLNVAKRKGNQTLTKHLLATVAMQFKFEQDNYTSMQERHYIDRAITLYYKYGGDAAVINQNRSKWVEFWRAEDEKRATAAAAELQRQATENAGRELYEKFLSEAQALPSAEQQLAKYISSALLLDARGYNSLGRQLLLKAYQSEADNAGGMEIPDAFEALGETGRANLIRSLRQERKRGRKLSSGEILDRVFFSGIALVAVMVLGKCVG